MSSEEPLRVDEEVCSGQSFCSASEDESCSPSLPDRETMRQYYHGELPDAILREYDQNCVRFPEWALARAQIARDVLKGRCNTQEPQDGLPERQSDVDERRN